jgi:retron-type reverse transcriptase
VTLLELLNLETGASVETLSRIIRNAPRRYKVYQIPKRTGGTRTIAHPARELKVIQRIILRNILDDIEVSSIATAYVKNRGIAYNAKAHINNRWILKLDFRDFFHSIGPADWDRAVRRTPKLKELSRDSALFHKILFWGMGGKEARCLSIGAPTSPSVSNLVCSRLDAWIIEQAERIGIRVTRYADDLTISGDSVTKLLKFEKLFENALAANKGVKFSLNAEKRGLYGPGERRMVTGIILTPDGRISIGRERKREISSLIHRFSVNNSDREATMKAKGLLAFAMSVEPVFFQSMQKKYGEEIIHTLMRANPEFDLPIQDLEF